MLIFFISNVEIAINVFPLYHAHSFVLTKKIIGNIQSTLLFGIKQTETRKTKIFQFSFYKKAYRMIFKSSILNHEAFNEDSGPKTNAICLSLRAPLELSQYYQNFC